MDHLNKIIFLFIISMGLIGCGVKGSPLPPLNPAPLGHGEPTLKTTPQKKSSKKSSSNETEEKQQDPSVQTEEQ